MADRRAGTTPPGSLRAAPAPWRKYAVTLASNVHSGAMGTAHPKCDCALHSLANYIMRYEAALNAAQTGELLEDTDVGT